MKIPDRYTPVPMPDEVARAYFGLEGKRCPDCANDEVAFVHDTQARIPVVLLLLGHTPSCPDWPHHPEPQVVDRLGYESITPEGSMT